MKKVLVSGKTGQLGSELQLISKDNEEFLFDFKSSSELDLSSEESIRSNLQDSAYDFFINAGAYTAVDKAEEEVAQAFAVNGMALYHIGQYIPRTCQLIHISSDYVYHHNPGRPLVESDPTHPQGIYAQSKKQGEEFVISEIPNSIIIRTSWVYSVFGKNFVKTMLCLGQEKDLLSIVEDQVGTPTNARDLAICIIHIIRQNRPLLKTEIYNFSNLGVTNWAEFAQTIFDIKNIDCKIRGITTVAYNAPAPRPLWSVLSKQKIMDELGAKIDEWEVSLRKCLQELG